MQLPQHFYQIFIIKILQLFTTIIGNLIYGLIIQNSLLAA